MARLEILRQKAQQKAKQNDYYTGTDLLAGDEIINPSIQSTEQPTQFVLKPFRNRKKFRKYIGGYVRGQGVPPGGQTGPVRKFGKRVRSRKRPVASWAQPAVAEQDGLQPTVRPRPIRIRTTPANDIYRTTPEDSLRTEEYSKKFRPFFDRLYSQLTGSEEEKEDQRVVRNRVELPRKRSTTPNPYPTLGKQN